MEINLKVLNVLIATRFYMYNPVLDPNLHPRTPEVELLVITLYSLCKRPLARTSLIVTGTYVSSDVYCRVLYPMAMN